MGDSPIVQGADARDRPPSNIVRADRTPDPRHARDDGDNRRQSYPALKRALHAVKIIEGKLISATATASDLSTSEFGRCATAQ